MPVLLFKGDGDSGDLPSFPTRRSSDLGPLLDPLSHRGDRAGDEGERGSRTDPSRPALPGHLRIEREGSLGEPGDGEDRKSTRLNSSHVENSYAVFCLKKKNEVLYAASK